MYKQSFVHQTLTFVSCNEKNVAGKSSEDFPVVGEKKKVLIFAMRRHWRLLTERVIVNLNFITIDTLFGVSDIRISCCYRNNNVFD